MSIIAAVDDHVLPQLLTSAIEAYEFEHRAFEKGKAKHSIETYGLLWGYAIPARSGYDSRIVVTVATVETSALRHENWVRPNLESLVAKKDFIRQYWPQLELVGTFHSHPYDDLSTVNEVQGWRASSDDRDHWPWIHKALHPDLPAMLHLVLTITALKKKGTAWPSRLAGTEASNGFVLSSDYRKFWINGYCTEQVEDGGGVNPVSYAISENLRLDIPSLSSRFSA